MDEVTNPEGEVTETPAVEDDFAEFEAQALEDDAEEVEAEPDDDDDNPDEEPSETEEAIDDDLAEVEINGKTYKVPKDAALRHQDYTRKTQEVSELRKGVEATLERLTAVGQEETQALANVAIVNAELAQYQDVDWDAWDQSDPQEANRHWRRFSQLKEAAQGAVHAYQQAQHNAQSIAQQESAKRVENGLKTLAEKIPNWGKDTASAILDFGVKQYGFDPDELKSIDNPLAILVLYEAMEGHKSRQQATTKAKIAKQQAVKPVPTLKGNSGRPAFNPATTDFAAFEKHASKALR